MANSMLSSAAACLYPLLAVGISILIVRGWGLPGSGLTVVAQVVVAAVCVALWPALILAEVGYFSLLSGDLILVAVFLGLTGWLRVRKRALIPVPRPRLTIEGITLTAILLASAILFSRPAEQIIGGGDPGVYLVTGINIARTGHIDITDETLAAVPLEFARDVLYRDTPGARFREGGYLPGYYITDAEEGKILPQFLHLFQTAIAIMYQIGGIRLALYATPLFGWLSILMLYLVGRELAGPAVGLLGASLLTLNISQIWFARVPFADVVVQFWLLAGLWALALLIEHTEKGTHDTGLVALLSGFCFGLTHLTKLDTYIAPLIVLGFASVSLLTRKFRRPHAILLGAYLALATQAALHAYLFSLPYVADIFHKFADYLRLAGFAAIIAVPLLILVARFRDPIAAAVSASSSHLAWLAKPLIIIVVLLSAYLYFVRPLRAELGAMTDEELAKQGATISTLREFATEPQFVHYPGRTIRTFVEEGLLRMSWYLTPVGVWLGIAGFLLWATSRPAPKAIPFLGATFVYSAIVFHQGAIRADFFWAFKRFIPLVIPAFLLMSAFALWRMWVAEPRGHLRVVSGALACFLFLSFIRDDLAFLQHVEYEGAVTDMTDLSELFPDNAVLLFEQSLAASRIGTPLRFTFGKTLFRVDAEDIDSVQMRNMARQWLASDRPVYWISPKGTDIQEYGPVNWLEERMIAWPRHTNEMENIPEEIHTWETRLQIYEIEGAEYNLPANLNINFDDQIVLLGYQLDKTAATSGDALRLDLYWYATKEVATDYTVFAHLIDGAMALWGQKDSPPVDGTRPTSGWKRGEIVHDALVIPISPDAPAGTCQLSIGLYEWPAMTRLPVLGENGSHITDHVVLTQIPLESAE